jgi:hypothetical protein
VQGLVSSVAELGVAGLFFRFVLPPLTFPELVGFGLAAGAMEAIILPAIDRPFRGTPVGDHAGTVEAAGRRNAIVAWLAVLERAVASVAHASARGLVYVGIASAAVAPAAVAIAAFTLVDGVAYYGHLQRWRFDESHVLAGVYGGFAAVAVVLAVSFLQAYARIAG